MHIPLNIVPFLAAALSAVTGAFVATRFKKDLLKMNDLSAIMFLAVSEVFFFIADPFYRGMANSASGSLYIGIFSFTVVLWLRCFNPKELPSEDASIDEYCVPGSTALRGKLHTLTYAAAAVLFVARGLVIVVPLVLQSKI